MAYEVRRDRAKGVPFARHVSFRGSASSRASRPKARGVYQGRKPSIDPAEVRRLRNVAKLGPSAIARRLGIVRASVYRMLDSKAGGAG